MRRPGPPTLSRLTRGVPPPLARYLPIALVTLGFLAVYAQLRFRFLGSDSFSYFTQSPRFRGQDAGLRMSIEPAIHPAVVPLGHVAAGPEIVSVFPAGYS